MSYPKEADTIAPVRIEEDTTTGTNDINAIMTEHPFSEDTLNNNSERDNLTGPVYARYARNQDRSIIPETQAFFGDTHLRPPPPGIGFED